MPARSNGFRVLVAISVLFYPFSSVMAQTPGAKPVIDDAYLTQQTVVAAVLRPHQVLTNPNLQMLPVEIAAAAGEKYVGMDPAKIGRAIAVVEPPFGQTPLYAVFLQASEAFDLGKLSPEITQHTQPGEIGGREGLVSAHPALPCFLVLNEKTLVAGSQAMLEKLMDKNRPDPSGVIADLVAGQPPGDDLYLAVDLQSLRPLIMMGMAAASQEAPPEFQKFLQIPRLLQSAEAVVNLDVSQPTRLVAHAGSDADADRLETLIDEGLRLARAKMREDMEADMIRLRNSDDPIERATAAYMDRVSQGYLDAFKPARQDNTMVLFETDPNQTQQMTSVAVIGVLVALLLPAVQAAREAARRNQSVSHLKQLMLALHNHHDTFRKFPAHAIYSEDGKPLLSWRVAILPFIEEKALYDQFHLDEPWDSPHNMQLVAQMPAVFMDPSSALDPAEGKTSYLACVGDGLLFEKEDDGTTFRQVTDGTSMTIALVQVNDDAAQVWTKPTDWAPNPESPMLGLGGLHPGIFLAAFADGSVQAIAELVDVETFEALLTRGGGEMVNRP